MTHIVEILQPAFESSIALPILESELGLLFDGFATDVGAYVDGNFLGGTETLDEYDDGLPDGLPSLEEYRSVVLPALEQAYLEANAQAVATALQTAKDQWDARVKNTIQIAIDLAIADAVNGLLEELETDDPLPYLDASGNEAFENELTLAAESHGDSRTNCEAVDSMSV